MAIVYTGTGAIETPPHILLLMREIAAEFGRRGYMLRTGPDDGADHAFETGALMSRGAYALYQPWADDAVVDAVDVTRQVTYQQACAIAAENHPSWALLKEMTKKRMAAEVMRVLGTDLQSPSRAVVVWGPEPKLDRHGRLVNLAGHSGMAVRVAALHDIPCLHLEMPRHLKQLDRYFGTRFADMPLSASVF